MRQGTTTRSSAEGEEVALAGEHLPRRGAVGRLQGAGSGEGLRSSWAHHAQHFGRSFRRWSAERLQEARPALTAAALPVTGCEALSCKALSKLGEHALTQYTHTECSTVLSTSHLRQAWSADRSPLQATSQTSKVRLFGQLQHCTAHDSLLSAHQCHQSLGQGRHMQPGADVPGHRSGARCLWSAAHQ